MSLKCVDIHSEDEEEEEEGRDSSVGLYGDVAHQAKD